MDSLSTGIVLFNILIYAALFGILIYLIIRRIRIEGEEDFEKRDN